MVQRVQKLERQLLVFTVTWERVLLSSLWGLRWPHNDPHGGQPEGAPPAALLVSRSSRPVLHSLVWNISPLFVRFLAKQHSCTGGLPVVQPHVAGELAKPPAGGELGPALGSERLPEGSQVCRPASLQPRLPHKVGRLGRAPTALSADGAWGTHSTRSPPLVCKLEVMVALLGGVLVGTE